MSPLPGCNHGEIIFFVPCLLFGQNIDGSVIMVHLLEGLEYVAKFLWEDKIVIMIFLAKE